MLPFTKRPGRGDESGDNDVVTKDDLVTAETINPTANAREAVRAKFSSLSDDEMTNIMPSKSIGDALESARAASPRPAAGMPPPSSARTHSRAMPPAASSKTSVSSAGRSGKFAAIDEEEEDGRTVVRGAPKIVKRAPGSGAKMGMPTSPTTISPAAVIKATLESARAGKRNGDHLMAPPPRDLLEDLADVHPADGPGSEHTKILMTTGSGPSVAPPPMHGAQTLPLQQQHMGHASLPPASTRPMSNAPPSMGVGHTTGASGGYPSQQSGAYAAHYNGPVPSGSVSVPGVAMPPPSMPAHFMVPQPPYSDARIDPPGTAVTARTKVAGRPAMSWAMAVMSFGLFVGVGAFAVMKGNGSEGFMETSASFVDPARAGAAPAAKAAAAAALTAPTPTPAPIAPSAPEQPSLVGVPGVAVPAAGAAAAPPAATAVAGTATPAVPPAPATTTPPPAAVAAVTPPAPTAKRPHFVRPQPAAEDPPPARPAPVAVAPPATTKPPKAPRGTPAAGGNSPTDEEQRAALKALQDSQLERSLGQ